jgi:4-amino-4-deoxy-L-arabinose transferase-like glycosyltransferase
MPPAHVKPRLPDWLPGLSLIILGLLIFLPAIWDWPLIRAEAMYALIPKEMYAGGHWLTPALNGARYLDKPPLFYWVNLIAYHLFGVSDRVARLPTLVIGLGEVWFTYLIGRRLLGARSAWLGGFVLLTSLGSSTSSSSRTTWSPWPWWPPSVCWSMPKTTLPGPGRYCSWSVWP